MSTFFDRTSDIKEQWQKDLARVYRETNALLASRIGPFFIIPPEVLEESSNPKYPEIFRVAFGLTQNGIQIISTGILYTYLKVTRPILFDALMSPAGNDFISSITPTASEIYDGLRMICPVAVPLLIEKIEGCPLLAKEQLKKAFQDQRRDDFVECINNLDCDISSLNFYSTVLALERWLYLAMFTNPQAYLDFVYHRNLGSISDMLRAATPSEQELREAFDVLSGSPDFSSEAPSLSWEDASLEQKEEAITNAEQMKIAIKSVLQKTTRFYKDCEEVLFPFEKEYYTNLLELPYVRQVVEEIENNEQIESPEKEEVIYTIEDVYNISTSQKLELPDDFFTNDAYGDGTIDIIAPLPTWITSARVEKFAAIVEKLALNGYIEPSLGNRRKLVSVLSGRRVKEWNLKQGRVSWFTKMDRKVNQTEKMALWLSQFLYGGRYEAVYRVFGFNRSIKKGNEPSYITYADKPLQVQIEALYPNRPAKKAK